jgi:uncharacterized membrane protein
VPERRRNRWIRWGVIVFKLVTGGAELGAGTLLLVLGRTGLANLVDSLTSHERAVDPADPVVHFVERHLPSVLSHEVAIAIALLLLGAAKVTGAIGLIRRRPWAYWLLVALLVLVVPFDAHHLITKPHLGSAILAVLNVAVLVVLIVFRKPLIAREED